MDIDVIIIGSGFGGSVHACRLSEAGYKVVVLERGRRWTPETYPRNPDDAWLYDIDEPERQNGWIDFRYFKDMSVVQGAGVGGGSLIYANVFIDSKPQAFETGWPSSINYETLKPHYEQAFDMLVPETLPDNQLTPRYLLMKEAAKRTQAENHFSKVDIAVSFDKNGIFPKERLASEEAQKTFVNKHGQKQGYCVHAGNCDIGCKAQAKNTLDLNYLAVAEKNGAVIKPLCIASHISRIRGGYSVTYHELSDGKKTELTLKAKKIVLCAGSLGSTDLLLRSRDIFKTLPKISQALGKNWSSNGDFLTPAFYKDRHLSPSIGPTITAAIDYLDGRDEGAQYFVEDGGFPDVLSNIIRSTQKRKLSWSWKTKVIRKLASIFSDGDPLEGMMPWFGQAMDGGDGRLYYGRDWLRPWQKRLKLKWNISNSKHGIEGLIRAHKKLSECTNGKTIVPFTWTIFKDLITPHPLGGCRMADDPAVGVVNNEGEVFGYINLYVSDGSIIPRPLGLNPSKTITALAERNVQIMIEKDKNPCGKQHPSRIT